MPLMCLLFKGSMKLYDIEATDDNRDNYSHLSIMSHLPPSGGQVERFDLINVQISHISWGLRCDQPPH